MPSLLSHKLSRRPYAFQATESHQKQRLKTVSESDTESSPQKSKKWSSLDREPYIYTPTKEDRRERVRQARSTLRGSRKGEVQTERLFHRWKDLGSDLDSSIDASPVVLRRPRNWQKKTGRTALANRSPGLVSSSKENNTTAAQQAETKIVELEAKLATVSATVEDLTGKVDTLYTWQLRDSDRILKQEALISKLFKALQDRKQPADTDTATTKTTKTTTPKTTAATAAAAVATTADEEEHTPLFLEWKVYIEEEEQLLHACSDTLSRILNEKRQDPLTQEAMAEIAELVSEINIRTPPLPEELYEYVSHNETSQVFDLRKRLLNVRDFKELLLTQVERAGYDQIEEWTI